MAKRRNQLQLPILTDVKQARKLESQSEGITALKKEAKTPTRSDAAATAKDIEIYRSISRKYFK